MPFEREFTHETEDPGAKFRPVVVVRLEGDECVCLPCTSADSRFRLHWLYAEVHDLLPAGLSRPTGVRRREIRIQVDDCLDVLGALSDRDRAQVLGDPHAGPTPSAGEPPA